MMRKILKPYILLMGGNQFGFYKTLSDAVEAARVINTNKLRSGGPDYVLPVKVVYEQVGQPIKTVHEE